MFAFKSTALLVFSTYIALSLAAPSPSVGALPSGDVKCGKNIYTPTAVDSAVAAGAGDLQINNNPNSYPHQFSNREGIHLSCASTGPWFEFPILPGGKIFNGGPPGADRVIFSGGGNYCAVVTHTGASTPNGFVACT